jgi:hypothetical protein
MSTLRVDESTPFTSFGRLELKIASAGALWCVPLTSQRPREKS